MRRFGTLLAFASFGVYWGAWGVLVPDVKEQVDASVAELGVALLAVGFAALPAMLLTGRLVDRVGARAMPAALALFGVAALLPGFAGSVPELALALILVGATSGALDVVINVTASGLEASGGTRLMQLAHAAFSAGSSSPRCRSVSRGPPARSPSPFSRARRSSSSPPLF